MQAQAWDPFSPKNIVRRVPIDAQIGCTNEPAMDCLAALRRGCMSTSKILGGDLRRPFDNLMTLKMEVVLLDTRLTLSRTTGLAALLQHLI